MKKKKLMGKNECSKHVSENRTCHVTSQSDIQYSEVDNIHECSLQCGGKNAWFKHAWVSGNWSDYRVDDIVGYGSSIPSGMTGSWVGTWYWAMPYYSLTWILSAFHQFFLYS